MKTTLSKLLIITISTFPLFAFGDDVTDAIDNAIDSYKGGDLSNAAAQLDYAAALVRQQKAANVTSVFCDPLDGWTAEEAESNSAGGMMFGGGVSASRRYSKSKGQVNINLVMDSPMLSSIVGMINNPALITMSGGKLTKVQGQNAMLKSEGSNHTVTFIVNGNALFTIEGSRGATLEEVLAYGNCLKLDAL